MSTSNIEDTESGGRETQTSPPISLPEDCHHAWMGYDRDSKELSWSCGVDEDGNQIMFGDGGLRQIDGEGRDCRGCRSFDDKRIRYPLVVEGIDVDSFSQMPSREQAGSLVLVWFMEGEERRRDWGILLGELAIEPLVSYSRDTRRISVNALGNPAIFVPSVRRIVWGCESWWHPATVSDIQQAYGSDGAESQLAAAWADVVGDEAHERPDGCDDND